MFLVGSVWLFSVSSEYLNPNEGKNWWSIYFIDPKSQTDISFIIDNHGDKQNFHWTVSSADGTIKESDTKIEKEVMYKIKLDAPQNISGKNIMIEVSDGENKKEIYKNF